MSVVSQELPAQGEPSGVGSQRKFIEGLRTPFPLVDYTPSMLAEDPVVQLLLTALDQVLAPIISVLDCYDAYLDPYLAPIDFVEYMSSWLLVTQDEQWTENMKRTALASCIQRSTLRGTKKSFEDRLSELFGDSATVTDSGKVVVSAEPTDPNSWEPAASPSVTVDVPAAQLDAVSISTVKDFLNTILPAHVAMEIRSQE
jgi:phage tail-like protein